MKLMVTDLDIKTQIFTIVDLDDNNKKVQSNPNTLRNVLKTNDIINAKLNKDGTGFTVSNPTNNKPLYKVTIHSLINGFKAEIINLAELERKEIERKELERLREEKLKAEQNKILAERLQYEKKKEAEKSRVRAKVDIRGVKSTGSHIGKTIGSANNFKAVYYRGKMYIGIKELLKDLNPSGDKEFNDRFIDLYNQGYSLDVCIGNKPATSENLRAKALKELSDRESYYSTEITKY